MALEITQKRSKAGAKKNQIACLQSLGLRRIGHTVVKPDRPEFRGMIFTVKHMVEWREVDDSLIPKKES